MEAVFKDLSKLGNISKNAVLSAYTTFKSGGPADILLAPYDYEKAAETVKYCAKEGISLTVIGAGSNLVVGDSGIRGVVMRISSDVMPKPVIEKRNSMIFSEAAVMKEDFIKFAVSNSFSGIEFMAGIPGSVGGGIVMNAGTFMGTFIDWLKEITYIDKDGNFQNIKTNSSMAHYRGIDIDGCAVIVSGSFEFPEGDSSITQKKIDEIICDRKSKHPWTYPSAGSVFKNPEGGFAWKLVNDSGLKGYKIGGAQVSELHTNFIVNAGNATSSDIRNLVYHVQKTVFDKFGIELHTEIKMIGEF
ncbi:MAG: UDP-N-acetylmuramate dehydrogenase [Spirochaetes bacterium]|nr:UDP-N-acetylmuramate dehydrogenase [Spirochaetota bacterium]MBP9023441.1 UDP-N-acetylmuramate dehydrogenase [Spirochaetota bacterium]